MVSKNSRFVTILGMILALVVTAYAADSRTKLKPGWNLFSPKQDIDMGRESAKQAEMQLPILNDRQASIYIDTLGKRLEACRSFRIGSCISACLADSRPM